MLTKEQVASRLQRLSGQRKEQGLLNGVAYILNGDFEVTEGTRKELNRKLHEIAEGLFGEDFVTVVSAIAYLLPNVVEGDFTKDLTPVA